VRDVRGNSLEGYTVQLRRVGNGPILKSAVSDSRGRWQIAGVTEETYDITAQRDGRRTNTIEGVHIGWTDHRVVDGIMAARFLGDFKQILESPLQLVLCRPEDARK